MVYILTHNDYNTTEVHGVFTSVDTAKKFAEKVLGNKNLNWSVPDRGSIWADNSNGTFVIKAAQLDPTQASY